MALQHGGEGKDVADIVIHDQGSLARQRRVGLIKLFKYALFGFWQVGCLSVQKQGGFSQQAFRRVDVFDENTLSKFSELGFFIFSEILGCVHDHRQFAQSRIVVNLLQQCKDRRPRQPEIEHHTVEALGPQRGQRLRRTAYSRNAHVVVADQFHDALTLLHLVFHHQEFPLWALDKLSQPDERLFQRVLADGLFQEREGAPLQADFPVFFHRDDMHWDVPGRRVNLQTVKHRQPIKVRQVAIQCDGIRMKLARDGVSRLAL